MLKLRFLNLLLKHQFTNLCKFTGVEIAVLKFTVKIAKATHLQTYVNSLVLNLRFLNSLLNPQFTNLCKFTGVEIAVLKFTVKSAIYKPM